MIKREWQRMINRTKHSWWGLIDTWSGEPSFKFWTCVNVASATLALLLPLTTPERALILALGILILAAECLNTGIEHVVDHLSPEPHPLAKKAKDASSAGVALAAIAAGIAWLVVLLG